MTALQYSTPTVPARWIETRETHPAVAMAIHAIADNRRSANVIWEAPTPAEWDHVTMAVEQYVHAGMFDRDDTFSWGAETVTI